MTSSDTTLERPPGPVSGTWLTDIRPSRGEVVFFGCLAVFLSWLGLGDTRVGALLAPLIGAGPEAEAGLALHIATGVLLAGAVALNVLLLRALPFRFQVLLVWLELLVVFIAFVDSFNRDLGVWFETTRDGQTNIAFLITTGAVTTLYVSLLSILIACGLALVAALARLSASGPAYAVSTFYISFFRGTPLLLQVYLIYIGLPQLGPQFALEAVPSGILALSLCYGAYLAEIFRAGIAGVPQGQRDAAAALGLSNRLTFRKIVFPQAMRLIVPPTGNQFIAMLKDSSLVSVMGVWELTRTAQIIGKRDFKVFEMLIAAAIIYWFLSICFEIVQSRIERHYGKGYQR
ncbi:amino acid ABC transporter permease [Aquibium sp. A9E412]|uniref:amino acid ABC transporter permease n=1 Tax=Aquibium sp. A9E412 TaxID=2976767 RepID=UPI0025B2016B|nr:amino acid ABC transporter permease [Aquibium sp. A9E412]MDN2566236.1 amino acid ABC transporter permease [Aquibium sp. A9E412]